MRGMLFRQEMNKAIREGRKTVTRRLSGLEEINQEPDKWELLTGPCHRHVFQFRHLETGLDTICWPRYQVGEVVYVKEAWRATPEKKVDYKGDWDIAVAQMEIWKSPLFMPAWAARTFLKIIRMRPERLQAITAEDCIAEGLVSYFREQDAVVDLREQYYRLWNSINSKQKGDTNPWVWLYTLKVVERPKEKHD